MPGLFGIYEIGRRSLLSFQTAIHAIGHNVANAATPGFHRQRVEFSASPTEGGLFGNLGTGVRISDVQRVENRFLDLAVQRELPTLARFSARSDALLQTELVLGEPSEGGLTTILDDFFGAWDDLASSPEDSGVRESVVQFGIALTDAIRNARTRLEDQQANITGEVGRAVDDVNRILRELHAVNRSIATSGGTLSVSPDLEDRRDLLVETLADLAGATAKIEDDGTATVWIAQRVVAQRETVQELSLDLSRSDQPALGGRPFESGEIDGRIGGLLEVRDVDLAEAIERLDAFAARLVQDVNALHRGGMDAHGNLAGDFFTLARVGSDGVEGAALGIRVAEELRNDATRIAAGAGGAPADNGIALDIAALRRDPTGAQGMLRGLVVDLGARSREALDLLEGQRTIVDSFRAQRDSVSGVSLDEEAAHLLRFQRSFQASAQVLAAADELTQTILAL